MNRILLFLLWVFTFQSFGQQAIIRKVRIINSSIPSGVCNNQTVTLTADYMNVTPTAHQWYKNGVLISGATSSTLTASSLISDEFKLEVTASTGSYSFSLPMSKAYNCVVSANGQLISNTNSAILTHNGKINDGRGVSDKGKIINVTSNIFQSNLILDLDFRNVNSRSTSNPSLWYDLTSNHNDATLHGNVSWYSDARGGALNFNGTNYLDGSNADYAQVKEGSNFTGFNDSDGFSGSFTIQSWIYINANANWNRIIDFGNGAGDHCVLFTNNFDTKNEPGLHIEGSQFACNQVLSNNIWHHLVATFKYPSTDVGHTNQGEATIYIDGSATGVDSQYWTTVNNKVYMPRPTSLNRTRCYIGRSNWWDAANHDADFNGGMGAVQIYNRALTASEVLSNYNNSKASYGR